MGLDQVIGKNIKAFREHLNYTQQEISDYLGISQPAYVKYEKGGDCSSFGGNGETGHSV